MSEACGLDVEPGQDGTYKSIRSQISPTDRSGLIINFRPDRSVGPSSFCIGLKSVRSKLTLLLVRSDSISKNIGPTHWTGPDRDRTEVVHPCLMHTFGSSGACDRSGLGLQIRIRMGSRMVISALRFPFHQGLVESFFRDPITKFQSS